MWFRTKGSIRRELLQVDEYIRILESQNKAIRLDPNEMSCVILAKNQDVIERQWGVRQRLVAELGEELVCR